jgi:malate dehydrogenase
MVDRPATGGKVSILGAGNVGAALAQRLVEQDLADVVLLDVEEGKPRGIALDLMQARAIEGHCRTVVGTADYAETADSDVLVVAAGFPRRPGMNRDDLLEANGRIVAQVVRSACPLSPVAILMVITNPLDAMTHLAWRLSGFAPARVLGMGGVLDAARFETFIAWELGVSVRDVHALVLGGHGDLMVPLPRFATVGGVPLTERLDAQRIARLVERARNGGAEVVGLLKTGGAYYAPASAAARMIASVLRDEGRLLAAAAHLDGQYGLSDLFVGVPIRLDRTGVAAILELDLKPEERTALIHSAELIRASLGALARIVF